MDALPSLFRGLGTLLVCSFCSVFSVLLGDLPGAYALTKAFENSLYGFFERQFPGKSLSCTGFKYGLRSEVGDISGS